MKAKRELGESNVIYADKLIKKDKLLSNILLFLRENSTQVYLAGGFLRDKLLGRKGKDIDLVIEGKIDKFGKELAGALEGSFFILGENQVARIAIKDKGQRKIDICVIEDSIEDDLKRRDFTVNSLAIDAKKLSAGSEFVRIIDVTGGLQDLKNKKISAMSSKTFKEDPLRILRAIRLSVELGFNIDPKTCSYLKESAPLVAGVSAERLQRELYAIFALTYSHEAIKLLDEMGIIGFILPEIEKMKGIAQNDYHHLDVWNHTLLALENLEAIVANLKEIFPDEHGQISEHLSRFLQEEFNRMVPLKLAVLLHDIGKPRTKLVDPSGIVHFYNHSEVGAKMTEKICKRLKASNEITKIVVKLVAEHMRPGFLSKKGGSIDRAIRRFLRVGGEETVEILLLSLADRRATLGPLSTEKSINRHENFIKKVMKDYFSTIEQPIEPLVDGYDLMKKLNIKPGKIIGELLEEIVEVQAEGRISTKEEALSFAEKYFEDYSKEKK